MKGRKAIPTKIKLLKGNPGRRKLNGREAEPLVEVPLCPKHLSSAARAEWMRIVPQLEVCGLISQLDRAALAAYCTAWGRWVEAERMVADKGVVVQTDKGNIIQNPYLAVANRAMEQMRRLLAEFGMTPSSRTGVKAGTAAKKDALEAFMAG